MAIQTSIPVNFDAYFPRGAFMVGEVEPVAKWSDDGQRQGQDLDKRTGHPLCLSRTHAGASTCCGGRRRSTRSSEEVVPVPSRSGRLDPKTRKPLPEGIRYRADRNKYQVRVWGIGLSGEQRERSYLVDSLAEAKKLRAEAQAATRVDGAMTLTSWHDRYWATIEAGIRPATARGYNVAWRKRVQPWLGHRKIESITVGDVEEAIAGWAGSASTRIDALSLLSRLMDGAARGGVISANPVRLARRPRDESTRSFRSRALTVSEVSIMLDAVEPGPYRAYLAALVYAGMRAGEGSALRVEDVDLLGRVIHVRRSFSPGRRGELIEQSPKSHKERAVPLPGSLVPFVTAAMAGKKRQDLVFTGPRGGRLSVSNVRRSVDWDRIRLRLERPDLRIHDLRHTLATLLFDTGVSANDVQAILGHSSMQVTERYSRARSDAAVRVGGALDALLDVREDKQQEGEG